MISNSYRAEVVEKKSAFDGKVLLITGGTGSFGNAVLNRFLGSDIKEVRIFSRDEKKQDEQRRKYADSRLRYYFGDTRDPGSVGTVTPHSTKY